MDASERAKTTSASVRGKPSPEAGDARQCQARSKRSGERCRRWACVGRCVCAIHGGRTPRGVASPHLVHGHYSRDLPAQLGERLESFDFDENRLSIRHEVALLTAMTDELLSRLPDERSETKEGLKEEDRIWRQVMDLIMAKARAVTAEVRCIRLSCDVLTPEEATALVAMLTRSVRRHVRDPEALRAIQREFEQIATTGRHDARRG